MPKNTQKPGFFFVLETPDCRKLGFCSFSSQLDAIKPRFSAGFEGKTPIFQRKLAGSQVFLVVSQKKPWFLRLSCENKVFLRNFVKKLAISQEFRGRARFSRLFRVQSPDERSFLRFFCTNRSKLGQSQDFRGSFQDFSQF